MQPTIPTNVSLICKKKVMKSLIFFFCLQILLLAAAAAQDLQRAKQTIADLASPAMYGRGYTFGGEQKAAHYIAQQFKKIGLQSYDLQKKHNYFQPFRLSINTFPKNPVLKLPTKNTKLVAGRDFIVEATSKSGKGSGFVYQVDTLLFAQSPQALADFLATDLRDKLLLYASNYEPALAKLPQQVLRHWGQAKAYLKTSPKLTMNLATEANLPPTYLLKDKLFGQATTNLLPNGCPIAFALTQQTIPDYETQNIVGYLQGTQKPDSLVVFSAHYDHLGSLGKEAIFFGANDNASGISLLLELAQHYKQNPPAYSVVFIAFGAEEVGLVGSKYFVENPLFALNKIKILINLDLVGTGNEGIGVVNATVFPTLFGLLEKINKTQQYFPKIIKRGKAANSDHYFFTEQGIPSFFIYTLGGIQAYHDTDDQAQTLPLTKYKELFDLLRTWVAMLYGTKN
jgi:aminopeptidase YwaD